MKEALEAFKRTKMAGDESLLMSVSDRKEIGGGGKWGGREKKTKKKK